jgi:asparagine N-glycosylation enzyme membrane subunit Stt3
MSPSVKIALGLIAAPPMAMLLGIFASDVLAISDDDIRDGALAAAGFFVAVVWLLRPSQ